MKKLTWPGRRMVTLITGITSPAGIEVRDGKIIFARQAQGNGIFRAELDGSALEEVVLGFSNAVEISSTSDSLFITEHGNTGYVFRYHWKTGELETLLSRDAGEIVDPTGVRAFNGLVLVADSTQETIQQYTLWNGQTSVLLSFPVNSANIADIVLDERDNDTLIFSDFQRDAVFAWSAKDNSLQQLVSCAGDCFGLGIMYEEDELSISSGQ